jgi:hypothetical protein
MQEVPVSDWLTLAETVSEIQRLRGSSLYEARMEMFGELFTGIRKAKGIYGGIVQEIERGWFIGQIGQQGVDWARSSMLKYGVEYLEVRISKLLEISAELNKESGPMEFNWDQFWVEIVRIANTRNGLPEDRGGLYRHMADFCATRFTDPPGETLIRDKLAMLHNRLPG